MNKQKLIRDFIVEALKKDPYFRAYSAEVTDEYGSSDAEVAIPASNGKYEYYTILVLSTGGQGFK